MLQSYRDKKVCVYDNGLFVELATTLSKEFGKTYYYSPWESAFPKSNSRLIGKGIPNVERVDDIWKIVDDCDLWVFPDVYAGGLQLKLEKLGKRVWGSRRGEELELYRPDSKEYLNGKGLRIGHYEVVKGLLSLRNYLKEHDDQWIKISLTRGDMESFHSVNYRNIEPRLDELEHSLGAKKDLQEFIVEQGIPEAVEVGYDGYCVDGNFPKKAMCGVEVKDKGYIGVFQDYTDMPQQIQDVNSQVAETLHQYRYRNFFSMEMRITRDGIPWVIDPCTRMGSPPGELVQMMYTNLADILWYGAEGRLIDPEPAGKYGVELLIHSSWADKNWQAVEFPSSVRDNVKFRNLTIIDGKYYVVPQAVGLPEIGAVVGVGDTLEEACDVVKKAAKKIEGYYVDVFPEALDEAQEEIKKLKNYGIKL
jgi:hypothetical protein